MRAPAAEDLHRSWIGLPVGARVALEEEWAGVAAGGLACGSAVVDANGEVVARGRNRVYDPAGGIETRAQYPLQHNALAHAEMNALACLPTETDHAALTLWTTQHPCAMCAATLAWVRIGRVGYVADDRWDHTPPERIAATHAGVPYQALGDPRWWTIANLLFLHNSAVQQGEEAGNLKNNRARYPALVALTLDLATGDTLGQAARAGISLPDALAVHAATLARVAEHAPRAV